MTIPCKAQNGLVIMCPGSQMARLTAPSSSITDPSTKEAIIRGQMGELNAGATMLCNFTEPLCKLDQVNVIYGGVNMMFNVKEEGGHWRPHQPPPHYLHARPHKTQLRNKHAVLHRNVDRRYEEEHRANWCQFVKVKRALAKDYMASRMLIPTPKTTMVVPLYIHQQLYNTQPCEVNINARNRTSCPCRPHYELFRELFDRSQWPPSASSGFHLVECKPGG